MTEEADSLLLQPVDSRPFPEIPLLLKARNGDLYVHTANHGRHDTTEIFLDTKPYFHNHRNMETEVVCFPEPLNACFWLNHGTRPETGAEPADPLAAGSPLPTLDQLFGEDWD